MSKFFVGFLNAAQLNALHNAGHAVEAFALSEPAKLVATLASSSIGATVKADITALMDQNKSGLQKFEEVVANTLPLVEKYVAGPGTIITDAEGIARGLVQQVYNDVVGAVKAAVAPAAAPAPATGQSAQQPGIAA